MSYLIAFAGLLAYVLFTTWHTGKPFIAYITDNKRTLLFAVASILLLVTFKSLVIGALAVPIVTAITTAAAAWNFGSIWTKIVGMWDRLTQKA